MKPPVIRLIPALAATFWACGSAVEPLAPPPSFSGVLSEVRAGAGGPPPALIIARTQGTAVVHLRDHVQLYRREPSRRLTDLELEDLTPGTTVDVWTTGIELRSLPPQYFGRQVVAR